MGAERIVRCPATLKVEGDVLSCGVLTHHAMHSATAKSGMIVYWTEGPPRPKPMFDLIRGGRR